MPIPTETSDATLGSFKTAGQPTTIDDIDGSTPPSIVEQFQNMDRWAETVHINGRNAAMLIGERVERRPETWLVFHRPEDTSSAGFAGTLQYDRDLRDPNSEVVAFVPAGNSPNGDVAVEPVTEFSVEQHSRTEQFDAVLNAVRTDLTDSDWSSGRADTGYGEWVQAAVSLVNFQREFYGDDQPFVLPVDTWTQARVTHAVARYPLMGDRFLSHVTNSIRYMDDGAYAANPEATRTTIVDYAKTHLDDETLDFNIEPSMGTVDSQPFESAGVI
jgi:hypothetical protein